MKLQFSSKFTENNNYISFLFTAPSDITWIAGQYIRLELNVNGVIDERWFTIASAPYEKQIQITTRVSNSAFKIALNTLKVGDEITAGGIGGDFIWHDNTKPKLFLAGGIGVTPFHSILKQRSYEGRSVAATLLYANPTHDITYKAELDAWQHRHPEFNCVYLVGQRLSVDVIQKKVPDITNFLVYLSGPEPLVEDVGSQLKTIGLTNAQLIQDWFPGYEAY